MNITFDNGSMVVTHDSGEISKYTAEQLEKIKTDLEKQQNKITMELAEISGLIDSVNASRVEL